MAKTVDEKPLIAAALDIWSQSALNRVPVPQSEERPIFIEFGQEHFDHLVSQYVVHYHTERPHQAMRNVPLTGEWLKQEGDPPDPETIVCRTRLGGLLKHYERRAA